MAAFTGCRAALRAAWRPPDPRPASRPSGRTAVPWGAPATTRSWRPGRARPPSVARRRPALLLPPPTPVASRRRHLPGRAPPPPAQQLHFSAASPLPGRCSGGAGNVGGDGRSDQSIRGGGADAAFPSPGKELGDSSGSDVEPQGPCSDSEVETGRPSFLKDAAAAAREEEAASETEESNGSSPSPVIFLDEEGYERSMRAEIHVPSIPALLGHDIEDSDSELGEFFDSRERFGTPDGTGGEGGAGAKDRRLPAPGRGAPNPRRFDRSFPPAGLRKPLPRKPTDAPGSPVVGLVGGSPTPPPAGFADGRDPSPRPALPSQQPEWKRASAFTPPNVRTGGGGPGGASTVADLATQISSRIFQSLAPVAPSAGPGEGAEGGRAAEPAPPATAEESEPNSVSALASHISSNIMRSLSRAHGEKGSGGPVQRRGSDAGDSPYCVAGGGGGGGRARNATTGPYQRTRREGDKLAKLGEFAGKLSSAVLGSALSGLPTVAEAPPPTRKQREGGGRRGPHGRRVRSRIKAPASSSGRCCWAAPGELASVSAMADGLVGACFYDAIHEVAYGRRRGTAPAPRRAAGLAAGAERLASLVDGVVRGAMLSAMQALPDAWHGLYLGAVVQFSGEMAEQAVFEATMEASHLPHEGRAWNAGGAVVDVYSSDLAESVLQEAFIGLSCSASTFPSQAAISISCNGQVPGTGGLAPPPEDAGGPFPRGPDGPCLVEAFGRKPPRRGDFAAAPTLVSEKESGSESGDGTSFLSSPLPSVAGPGPELAPVLGRYAGSFSSALLREALSAASTPRSAEELARRPSGAGVLDGTEAAPDGARGTAEPAELAERLSLSILRCSVEEAKARLVRREGSETPAGEGGGGATGTRSPATPPPSPVRTPEPSLDRDGPRHPGLRPPPRPSGRTGETTGGGDRKVMRRLSKDLKRELSKCFQPTVPPPTPRAMTAAELSGMGRDAEEKAEFVLRVVRSLSEAGASSEDEAEGEGTPVHRDVRAYSSQLAGDIISLATELASIYIDDTKPKDVYFRREQQQKKKKAAPGGAAARRVDVLSLVKARLERSAEAMTRNILQSSLAAANRGSAWATAPPPIAERPDKLEDATEARLHDWALRLALPGGRAACGLTSWPHCRYREKAGRVESLKVHLRAFADVCAEDVVASSLAAAAKRPRGGGRLCGCLRAACCSRCCGAGKRSRSDSITEEFYLFVTRGAEGAPRKAGGGGCPLHRPGAGKAGTAASSALGRFAERVASDVLASVRAAGVAGGPSASRHPAPSPRVELYAARLVNVALWQGKWEVIRRRGPPPLPSPQMRSTPRAGGWPRASGARGRGPPLIRVEAEAGSAGRLEAEGKGRGEGEDGGKRAASDATAVGESATSDSGIVSSFAGSSAPLLTRNARSGERISTDAPRAGGGGGGGSSEGSSGSLGSWAQLSSKGVGDESSSFLQLSDSDPQGAPENTRPTGASGTAVWKQDLLVHTVWPRCSGLRAEEAVLVLWAVASARGVARLRVTESQLPDPQQLQALVRAARRRLWTVGDLVRSLSRQREAADAEEEEEEGKGEEGVVVVEPTGDPEHHASLFQRLLGLT
ncbi:A-kinase anchor protein 11 isoform X2 [Lethenteron reissneri]|uniref:A-kinase anchor protein 11 isoform X2 n=1 Tax=Lethenteron reissneri TaxID=7753 RepID=UPI002AB73E15|nr:A-kinase anchor protein 11 isoform X2 [Lethenteron reissneri]